jgi:hypothetical protein
LGRAIINKSLQARVFSSMRMTIPGVAASGDRRNHLRVTTQMG